MITLQGEAAIDRLRNFSALQARRRAQGWRIADSEQTLECRIKGCPTLLRGKVDRIDENERTGELAIIDYKTWPRLEQNRYRSVQLPIYRAMVESSNRYGKARAHASKAFYCILAERAEDVVFDEEHACHEGGQSEAEDLVVSLLTSIAKGIFYPPSSDSMWQGDYGDLVWKSLADGLDPDWVADQLARSERGE